MWVVEALKRLSRIPEKESLKAEYYTIKEDWEKVMELKEHGLEALKKEAMLFIHQYREEREYFYDDHLRELLENLVKYMDNKEIFNVLKELIENRCKGYWYYEEIKEPRLLEIIKEVKEKLRKEYDEMIRRREKKLLKKNSKKTE